MKKLDRTIKAGIIGANMTAYILTFGSAAAPIFFLAGCENITKPELEEYKEEQEKALEQTNIQTYYLRIANLKRVAEEYAATIQPTTPNADITAKQTELNAIKDAIQADITAIKYDTTKKADLQSQLDAVAAIITGLSSSNPAIPSGHVDFARLKSDSAVFTTRPTYLDGIGKIIGEATYADLLTFVQNTALAGVNGIQFDTSELSVKIAADNKIGAAGLSQIFQRITKLSLSPTDTDKKVQISSGTAPTEADAFDRGTFKGWVDGGRLVFESGTQFVKPAGEKTAVKSAAAVSLADFDAFAAEPYFNTADMAGATKLSGNVYGVEGWIAKEITGGDISFAPGATYHAPAADHPLSADRLNDLSWRRCINYKNIKVAGTLSGVSAYDFAGGSFENANIETSMANTSFSGAEIKASNFRDAITNANFRGASIEDTTFGNNGSAVDGTGADFSNSTLNNAKYGFNLTLANAKFESADIDGAEFDRAILTSAKFGESNIKDTKFIGVGGAAAGLDFWRADISGTEFRNINIGAAGDFSQAAMSNVKFLGGTDLSGVKFDGATCSDIEFGTGTIYTSATSFEHSKLSNSRFAAGFDISGVHFDHAEIDGLSFDPGTFGSSDFTGIKGSGLMFAAHSDLENAVLTGAELSDWLLFTGGKAPKALSGVKAQGLGIDGSQIAAGTDISNIALGRLEVVNIDAAQAANFSAPLGNGTAGTYKGRKAYFDNVFSAIVNFTGTGHSFTTAMLMRAEALLARLGAGSARQA